MPALKDISGERFGMLVAQTYVGNSKWRCICDCGGTSTPKSSALQNGNTTSCGCRKRAVLGESTTKHGMHGGPTYYTWKGIRQRCSNPRHPRYADYGGRGITVCDRWRSFENFYADMGERPAGMSLDRIDNDGPYSPDNCRWTDTATQNLNKRNTVRINGVPLKVLADSSGVSYHTLYDRLAHGRPIGITESGITAPWGTTIHVEI